MNAKRLIAFAVAAAVGGPAWSEDGVRPLWSYPNASSMDDAGPDHANDADPNGLAASPFGALSGSASAEAPQNPYDLKPTQTPSDPSAPGVDLYSVPEANSPHAGQLNSELDLELHDPLAQPKEFTPNAELYGNTTAAKPAAARKTAEPLNGDPLGTLGFNPYDANSLLAPTTRPSTSTPSSEANPLVPGLPR